MAEKMEKKGFLNRGIPEENRSDHGCLRESCDIVKDSLAAYAEGVQLVQACKDDLCDVEKEMIVLSGENSGKE